MLSEVVEVEGGGGVNGALFDFEFLNACGGSVYINFCSRVIYFFLSRHLPRLNFDAPSQAINGTPRCVRKDAAHTFSVRIDLPQRKSAICVKRKRKNVSLS